MYTLHFQDSQVARVTQEGADLHIVFSSAYVSRRGESMESGYLAPLICVLKQATWQGDLSLSMGRLSGGDVQVSVDESLRRARAVPLPYVCDFALRLRLEFANHSLLSAEANELHIVLSGSERYTESYAC